MLQAYGNHRVEAHVCEWPLRVQCVRLDAQCLRHELLDVLSEDCETFAPRLDSLEVVQPGASLDGRLCGLRELLEPGPVAQRGIELEPLAQIQVHDSELRGITRDESTQHLPTRGR